MTDIPPVRPNSVNPPEELNPLLNPLLEQNLSRWAKIYFTTPPDAREQAVRELLRQLKSESGAAASAEASPVPSPLPVTASPIVCAACDRESSPEQQFCGFCGSPLYRQKTARVATPVPQEPPAETLSVLGLNPGRADNELQFLREKSFGSDYYEPDSASHRGRYAMVAIAIILAGVAYLEWPSLRSHLPSLSTVQAPAAASTAPQRDAPAPAEAQPSTAEQAQPQAVSPPKPVPPPTEESVPVKGNRSENVPQATQPLTLASRTETAALAPDGTQELLLAQRYLEGRGVAHDSGQAAALLWKAVSKQNSRADVLLADLYLRGDGVSKSCDQARLLLVAAAKKGAPSAAEKLRNLESSGCH